MSAPRPPAKARSSTVGALTPSARALCVTCGAALPAPAGRGHGGVRRYCGPRCRLLAWARRQVEGVAR